MQVVPPRMDTSGVSALSKCMLNKVPEEPFPPSIRSITSGLTDQTGVCKSRAALPRVPPEFPVLADFKRDFEWKRRRC